MRDDLKNIGSGRDGNAWAIAIVCLICLTIGFAIATGINHHRAAKTENRPTVTYAPCTMCHKVPVLDTAKKIRRVAPRQTSAADRPAG